MGSGGSGKGMRGRGRRRPRGGGGGGRPGGPKGPPAATQSPRRGKAFSTPYEVPDAGPIDPFDLFCAYFMGLMPDGTYRGAGLAEVAKRFRRTPGELRQMLDRYGMDPETLKGVGFDVSLAKLDIQVAPEGIDRRELARGLFEEFCDVHPTLTCAPVEVTGNGGRPGAHAPDAAPASDTPHRHAAHGAHGEEGHGDQTHEDEGPAEAGPAREGVPEAGEPDVEEEPEAAEGQGEEPEEASLTTADVGARRQGVPGGHEASGGPEPSHGGPADRPVRQIRRSPTRRGRGG